VTNLIANLAVNLTIFFYNAYLAIKPRFIKCWAKYIYVPEPKVVKVIPEFSFEDVSTTNNSFANEYRDDINKKHHLKLSRKPDFEDNGRRILWQRKIEENFEEKSQFNCTFNK
jgi:hypothetical protein